MKKQIIFEHDNQLYFEAAIISIKLIETNKLEVSVKCEDDNDFHIWKGIVKIKENDRLYWRKLVEEIKYIDEHQVVSAEDLEFYINQGLGQYI